MNFNLPTFNSSLRFDNSLINRLGPWFGRVYTQNGIVMGVCAVVAILAIAIFCIIKKCGSSSQSETVSINPLKDIANRKEDKSSQCAVVSKSIHPKTIENLKECIQSCKGAQQLEIVFPKVSFEDKEIVLDIIKEIADVVPDLEKLSLVADDQGGFPIHLVKGFDSLLELSKLKSLEITNILAGSLPISKNQAIEILVIKDCIISKFPREIETLKGISHLELTKNLFDEDLEDDDLANEYSLILGGLKESLMDICLLDFRLNQLPKVLKESNNFTKLIQLDLRGNPFLIESYDFAKQPNQTILYDVDPMQLGIVSTGKNVVMVGRTRAGKSTLGNVLANQIESEISNSIYSHTKTSNLKAIAVSDVLIEGKPAQINIQDTPGLFETTIIGKRARTNKEVLDIIFKEGIHFFGGKSFKNVNNLMFVISLVEGIRKEDISSLVILTTFFRRMGLPKEVKIPIVITRAEAIPQYSRNNAALDFLSHETIEKLIDKLPITLLFSGCLPSKRTYHLSDSELKERESNIQQYRIELLNTILDNAFITDLPVVQSEEIVVGKAIKNRGKVHSLSQEVIHS